VTQGGGHPSRSHGVGPPGDVPRGVPGRAWGPDGHRRPSAPEVVRRRPPRPLAHLIHPCALVLFLPLRFIPTIFSGHVPCSMLFFEHHFSCVCVFCYSYWFIGLPMVAAGPPSPLRGAGWMPTGGTRPRRSPMTAPTAPLPAPPLHPSPPSGGTEHRHKTPLVPYTFFARNGTPLPPCHSNGWVRGNFPDRGGALPRGLPTAKEMRVFILLNGCFH